jgi:glutathione S-transferase
MAITLYGTPPSPPSHTARLMLERKGIDHKVVWLLPGLWPALLRTRGFRGGTVPAMKIDGRRLQSSRAISRALEDVRAHPPLFPADPERRLAVEEAERWGDEVLQDVPRRIVRWITAHNQEARVMIAREVGIPLPAVAAFVSVRALLTIQDLRPAYEGRPAGDLAMRFLPEFGNDFPAGMLPAEWLEALRPVR